MASANPTNSGENSSEPQDENDKAVKGDHKNTVGTSEIRQAVVKETVEQTVTQTTKTTKQLTTATVTGQELDSQTTKTTKHLTTATISGQELLESTSLPPELQGDGAESGKDVRCKTTTGFSGHKGNPRRFYKGKFHLALQKLYADLPRRIQYSEKLANILFSKLILSTSELDNLSYILQSEGSEKHIEKMLKILLKKEEHDIVTFLEVLEDDMDQKQMVDYFHYVVNESEKELEQESRKRTYNSGEGSEAASPLKLKKKSPSLDLMLRIVNQPECIEQSKTVCIGNNNHLLISFKSLQGSDEVTDFIKLNLYKLKSELSKRLNIHCTCITKDERSEENQSEMCAAMVSVGFESGERKAYDMLEAKLLDFESYVFQKMATVVSIIQECIKITVNVQNIKQLNRDLENGMLLDRLCEWLKNEGFNANQQEALMLILLVDKQRLDEITECYEQSYEEGECVEEAKITDRLKTEKEENDTKSVHEKCDVSDTCSESSSIELNQDDTGHLKHFLVRLEEVDRELNEVELTLGNVSVSSEMQELNQTTSDTQSNGIVDKLIMARQCDDDTCMDISCREGKRLYRMVKDHVKMFDEECFNILALVAKHSVFCDDIKCAVPWCDFFYEFTGYNFSFGDMLMLFGSIYGDQPYKLNLLPTEDTTFIPLQDDQCYTTVPKEGVDFELEKQLNDSENVFLARQMDGLYLAVKKSRCYSESYQLLEKIRNLKHPNILTHLWAMIYLESDKLLLATQFEGENLRSHMKINHNDGMSVELLLPIIQELKVAMDFLHSMGLLYLNWLADNLLLGSSGEVKLSNFTSAITVESESYNDELALDLIRRLPPFLIPPELYNDEILFPQTDYWGFGALIYELATGNHIHWEKRHLSPEIQRDEIYENPTSDLSLVKDSSLQKLIDHCFEISPMSRNIISF